MQLRILDAAQRLLRSGRAEFSMRELAAEAGVSFATPFNQFGSKILIMRALSGRLIASMRARQDAAPLAGDAATRVPAAVRIAVGVMLAEPAVNKAVMGAIGSPNGDPGEVSVQSAALWAAALGSGEGLMPARRAQALAMLPGQLALVFRGVLSFWTAGEIADVELLRRAQAGAAVALLGFVTADGAAALEKYLARA